MEDNTSRVRLLPVEEDASASYVSTSLPARVKQNLRCKRGWSEVSGSLGDLGTFVPIVIALTLVNGLDLGTTLIFTGVYNILTGLIWGIPMPVQPMKSIAAVAISEGEHLTIPQIMAAGICTAGTLFTLGVTGLMGVLYRWLPLPVVRGVQLSQGLSFAFTAVKYVRKNQNFVTGKSVGDRAWVGWDGLILALVGFCFIVMVTGSGDDRQENQVGDEDMDSDRDRRRSNRYLRTISGIPSALIVFLIGIIIGIWRQPEILKQLTLGPSKLHIVSISKNDWKVGFLRAAIPQIPLSVLNSVIAVCKLSNDLFPLKEVTATSVSASVGVMNLVGCWFGAMPVCHGAGGLAGQYRFGARSGASVVFLGTAKMVLGLLLGSSLVKLLTQFPIGLLGVLLLFSGIELAMACRDMNSKQDSFVMLMCTSVSLTGSSAALGFGCGIFLYILLKLRELNYDDCVVLFRASRRKPSETMT